MRLRWSVLVVALLTVRQVGAAPNLPSGDLAWDELRDAIAEGRVPDPLGGVQSLGADRVFAALSRGRATQGWWATPVDRAILRTFAATSTTGLTRSRCASASWPASSPSPASIKRADPAATARARASSWTPPQASPI